MRASFIGPVAVGLLVVAIACMAVHSDQPPQPTAASQPTRPEQAASGPTADSAPIASRTFARPKDEEIKRLLTPQQFYVTQESGTEPSFKNAFWDHHEAGLYVDVVSGEPLFSSLDKFDSGTGWPSFTRPLIKKYIAEHRDVSLGMARVEVRSQIGNSHLGHVFEDGPAPTGLRYCINSAALRFIPASRLAAEGYTAFSAPFQTAATIATKEVAVLAGGCFWGMEDILRKIPGVLDTEVGYTGGSLAHPTYEDMKTGQTGHAEAVQVIFDPRTISFADLLEHWYFRMHDPTTKNRQGNDVGTQYRSAIFYQSAEQQRVAELIKAKIATKWPRPIATEIVAAGAFTPAESYHQDYLKLNPGGYTCHYMRD